MLNRFHTSFFLGFTSLSKSALSLNKNQTFKNLEIFNFLLLRLYFAIFYFLKYLAICLSNYVVYTFCTWYLCQSIKSNISVALISFIEVALLHKPEFDDCIDRVPHFILSMEGSLVITRAYIAEGRY